MKTLIRQAVTLLAITMACQAGLALAENYDWTSSGDQVPTPAGTMKAASVQAPSACDPFDPAARRCDEACSDRESCCCRLGCDDACKSFGIVGFAGLDTFKGISDSSFPGNFGAVAGLNSGVLLPFLDDYGLGWQTGLSYGIYDFDGRSTTWVDQSKSQQQIFLTTGFFHKAKGDRRLSYGVVYDWMFNDMWGLGGVSPTLGQWRGQIEYALSGCNAVGVWGCARDLSSVQSRPFQTEITNRAISQANLFWHHKFCSGADSYLWFGIPDHGRINGDGSLIDWTLGASVQVPLSEQLALYANGAYFHPSAAAGATAAVESGYDIGMGVVWYFGGGARSRAINGRCANAYMPVANNSSFLVDQSYVF
jgi:hypothetical protein